MTNRICFLNVSLVFWAACTGAVQASEPVAVGVAGRIKPPTSICTIQIPSEVQYGVIPKDKINVDRVTILDKKGFSARIECDQPARLTVQFVDPKSATAVDDPVFLAEVAQTLPDAGREHAYGLGLDSAGQKIGAMFLKIDQAYYASSTTIGLVSSASPFYQEGEDWVLDKTKRVRHQAKYTFAPAQGGYIPPIAMGRLDMDVDLVPVIDSGRLDLSKEIDVAGRITLEVSQI